MIAPNNIHPPKNWQDFETLCLKLWGEIWNIPDEIEFNSDNAQGQHGVDIYGPVEGGLKYNGVQCKNKKLHLIDGSPNRITVSDIQSEINKAKSFQPALNKLVIATTLPKDQKIEEYVRLQSVENLKAGLFSVQICFWEFFERKLPECPRVYDWYLKNENFRRVSSAAIEFSTGLTEEVYRPKFQKTIKNYVVKPAEEEIDPVALALQGSTGLVKWLEAHNRHNEMLSKITLVNYTYDWKQLFWFKLRITNSGESVIEDYKLDIHFEGDFKKVGRESASAMFAAQFRTDVKTYSNTDRALYIRPDRKILVQGDSYCSDSIYLEPTIAAETEITVYWRLLARDFDDTGKLLIKVKPLYHLVTETHYVKSTTEERRETSFELIQRPGNRSMMDMSVSFSDRDSDYTFIEL